VTVSTPTVLIVDDEEGVRGSVAGVLSDEGYDTRLASDGEEALTAVASALPDLVLLDIAMTGRDGIEILQELRKRYPELPVVMMSGHGTIETAVKATKLGAYDFLEKPLTYDQLLLCVQHGIERARLSRENAELREKLKSSNEIIGETEIMVRLKEQIGVAAPTDGWVLITGENGTGKELVAQQLHLNSERSHRPFVAVNCAAIPEELIESELFGHERGAFTGAVQQKQGRFELADGGTIFLDEIGDMSVMTQAKILRILQDNRFERVGGTETLKVDERVIAATNKNLEEEMEAGRFREDLFYRLNVIPFHVPSLRERADDIPLLLDRFLDQYCASAGKARKGLSPRAQQLLVQYPWPGNVRELQNIVERMALMTPGELIDVEQLPLQISAPDREKLLKGLGAEKLADARASFEREFLLGKLRDNGGNISRTSEVVGLARETLSRKLRALGIDPDEVRDGS